MKLMRTIAALMLSLLVAAIASGTPAGAQNADLPVINLINLPSDTGGQAYYALDLGFFKAAGIDVRITNMTSSPAIVSAVASGAADIGFSVVGTIALARSRGITLKFLAPGALWNTSRGTAFLVSAKDSTFQKAPDYNGKTIAVTGLADLTYYGTRAWLEKNGADVASVKFVELPFPEMLPAVVAHRVDGAMIAEPFLTAAKPDVKLVAPVDDAISPRFMSTGWVASDAWLKAHPDLAAKFAAVMRQTAIWANAHHAESGAILLKYAKLTPAIAATMGRVEYAERLDPKLIQPALDATIKYSMSGLPPVTQADIVWNAP